jgi:hypothetical protein
MSTGQAPGPVLPNGPKPTDAAETKEKTAAAPTEGWSLPGQAEQPAICCFALSSITANADVTVS